jgi:hypothetical protein
MSGEDRYSRQERLLEVGRAGQSRVLCSRVEVCGRDGDAIELLYLTRAGVASATPRPEVSPVPFAHAQQFRFAAARGVGAGAWRALAQLRRILEIPPP